MSRWDDEGLWWEDEIRIKGKPRVRPTPTIPPSDWAPPKDFPNLSACKIIGVDTETYDPNLKTHGPGWARNDGHIVGVSISADANNAWYFPLRHEIQTELNMDCEQVFKFLRDNLSDDRPKVGANIIYDAGWLSTEDVTMGGLLYDVQYAEALIDEVSKHFALDSLANKYLGTGKVSEELYKWCSLAFGGNPGGNQRKNIYRAPSTLVGPYAEADAYQPRAILELQWPIMEELGLLDLFHLETKLTPILLGMQKRGVRVDLEAAEKARVQMEDMERTAQDELNAYAGFEVGVYNNEDLEDLCETKGIVYPTTAKGNSSFVQSWLENHHSKGMRLVTEVRKLNKSRVTFIENGIFDKQVNGRVHPSFHPLRGEKGGAVSGRFSSSNPNGQQIPSRHPIFAPLIRGLYVPDYYYSHYCKFDLSQIEYRLFAHDSEDEDLIRQYQDPKADFHKLVGTFLGGLLPRKIIKNFNFGSLYGMGKDKTAQSVKNNLKPKEIEDLYLKAELTGDDQGKALALHFMKVYADQFPSAKATLERFAEIAQSTGEIRTILNRRSTFNLWEPIEYGDFKSLPYDEAFRAYGPNIKRAMSHKALNRRLQGGAADLMKKGMVDAYEAGLFAPDKLGFPHLIVHDEWGFSYHQDLIKHFADFKEIIEHTIPLKVPVILDAELGPDWGHVEEVDIPTIAKTLLV